MILGFSPAAMVVQEATPNPSSGIFKISTQALTEEETFSVSVYDMKGQLVYVAATIASEEELYVETCSNGIYMVQLTSSKRRNMVKKLSISK